MNITTSKIEKITPEIAAKMLLKNINNRPITQSRVMEYAREMRIKNFHFTGEAIKFDGDGNLLDGQHRLLAVEESKETVEMLVIRGLDKEAFKYMDTGRTRQAQDVLAIEGIKNAPKIAAMVKFILIFTRLLQKRRPNCLDMNVR